MDEREALYHQFANGEIPFEEYKNRMDRFVKDCNKPHLEPQFIKETLKSDMLLNALWLIVLTLGVVIIISLVNK